MSIGWVPTHILQKMIISSVNFIKLLNIWVTFETFRYKKSNISSLHSMKIEHAIFLYMGSISPTKGEFTLILAKDLHIVCRPQASTKFRHSVTKLCSYLLEQWSVVPCDAIWPWQCFLFVLCSYLGWVDDKY